MSNFGTTTVEQRAAQQEQIRKLGDQFRRAMAQGQIKVSPALAQQIREQARRTQEQGMER